MWRRWMWLTLCRCARDYHERVIEPTRTTKHAAQWIASLETQLAQLRASEQRLIQIRQQIAS